LCSSPTHPPTHPNPFSPRRLAQHGIGAVAAAAHDVAAAAALRPTDAKLAADAARVQHLADEYAMDRHQTIKKQGDALYQKRVRGFAFCSFFLSSARTHALAPFICELQLQLSLHCAALKSNQNDFCISLRL
jgi:hypothetical protein